MRLTQSAGPNDKEMIMGQIKSASDLIMFVLTRDRLTVSEILESVGGIPEDEVVSLLKELSREGRVATDGERWWNTPPRTTD